MCMYVHVHVCLYASISIYMRSLVPTRTRAGVQMVLAHPEIPVGMIASSWGGTAIEVTSFVSVAYLA